MDDRFIHLIRSNAIASTPVYDNYFNNTTAFRPKPEDIFKCGQTLKKTKQKYTSLWIRGRSASKN